MAGLQRSEVSFRRQGSSGIVWDDKLLSGELRKISTTDENIHKAEAAAAKGGGGGGRAYRTVDIGPTAAEPPSPRVSGCGVCGMFGKKPSTAAKAQMRKHGHRKS